MAYRIVLYSPDRAIVYDGRTPDRTGVGGGITARLSLLGPLAAMGHDVTAYVNCRDRIQHDGVTYVPLDEVEVIEADALIAISTGGDLSFAPLRNIPIRARRRVVWVQGVPKPADLDAVGADTVAVASEFLRGVVVDRWGVERRRVFVSYNGLHQKRFEQAEAAAPPIARDPFAIAYIGPPEKGLASAVEVLRRLRAHDVRYHLDVYGGGRLWGRTTDDVPDEPGARSMGLLGQAALVPRLFEYEFCLAPQAMEEGFGIAVQEARRAGQIVIASRVGAFGELIRDGVDGFLVTDAHATAASAERMTRIILDLAGDGPRRESLRREAIAAASQFSWTRAAREWTDELLADQNPLRATYSHPTILLAGYYGHGNLGDEAILHATLSELQRASPPVSAIVVSGDPRATAALYGVEAVHERDIPAIERAAERADAVVLGGGGVLHDHFGVDEATMLSPEQWGLAYCASLPALASKAGKPFAIVGAGVGPLSTETGRRLTRLIFERASLATVRDPASRDLLQSIGVQTAAIRVDADLAFMYVGRTELRSAEPRSDVRSARRTARVAVAVRSWDRGVDAVTWQAELAAALDRLVSDGGPQAEIVFVPFQATAEDALTDDRIAADAVRDRMRHRASTSVAPACSSADEARRLFAESGLVIAMRLHAVILAALAGAPVVALGYDDKVRATMAQLGLDAQVVDLAGLTAERLIGAVHGGAALSSTTLGAASPPALAALAASARRSLTDLIDALRSGTWTAPPASPEWTALIDRVERTRVRSPEPPVPGRRGSPAIRAIHRAFRPKLQNGPSYAFDRYKRARQETYGDGFARLRAPGEPGLVSIVLPVYNGGAMVKEAIDSVLHQTYARFDLIVIDDGSTDATAGIVDACAARDARVRVVHQENRTLPAALSRGFRMARGEFLTWTSADNRMKTTFLEKMVACLRRHPSWDMTYANIDVIGEDGTALRASAHYEGYQRPPGSGHVMLPHAPAVLNTEANNFVGAAFLYRSRVAYLLGDYSRLRFVMEDYDYWMRLNALMTLRHADFDDAMYEYRFHSGSLTSRWDQFDMLGRRARMMVFDDFRRDACLQPIIWVIDDAGAPSLSAALRERVRSAGHFVRDGRSPLPALPRFSVPVVYVRVTSQPDACDRAPRLTLPACATAVLIAESDRLPQRMDATWDACFTFSAAGAVPQQDDELQGWLAAGDLQALFSAIDARAKSAHLALMETIAESDDAPAVKATVVVCTRGATGRLQATLDGVSRQDFARPYEVIVVDNREDGTLADAGPLADVGRVFRPGDVRAVVCPIPGLSAARNAGLAEARGEIVCFLDDDAVPEPSWLARIVAAFDAHPGAGVVGGTIRLRTPEPAPAIVRPGWRKYWSEFVPNADRYIEVADWGNFPWGANWSARRDVLRAIGGFRSGYGRTGDNFWGGEEMVAACLARRLGYAIGIEPRAVVTHHVDPARFTIGHVFRTMMSGSLVRHRAQQDQYLVREDSLETLWERLRHEHVDAEMRGDRWQWVDVAFRKAAQLRLVAAEVADLCRRAPRAVSRH